MRVKSFYKWYIDWYKTILNEMTIIISLPNELLPFKEDKVVVIELFKPTSDFVVTEPYLKAILEKADEFGITIYIDPEPRYPTKNTKEGYIFWYKEFGFEVTPNQEFMKRIPKIKNISNYEVVI
jgi:signal recognition particle subunit SEC65